MKVKIKIADKKRFVLSCVFLLLMIVLMSKLLSCALNSKKGQAVINNVALAADKDGSIAVEENEFYKKYTITCKKDMEKIMSDEKDDFIQVAVLKETIDNVSIKSDGKVQDNDVTYEKNENRVIIKFKKKFKNNNYIYIDNESKKKIVLLLSKKEKPYNHVAVLDPGHGGADKGTNYKNIYEKDITLKIVNYAEKELIYKGCKIIKTRNEDKWIDLDTIPSIANAANAEAFVSVHINSNNESKYKGVSSYYSVTTKGEQKDIRILLAKTMQKELLKSDNWNDRGVLTDRLKVLRLSNIPAVLLECGFLSNDEDRDKLTKEEVLKNLGSNICNGLLNYLNSENNKGAEYYNKPNTQKNTNTEKGNDVEKNNDKTVTSKN